MAGHNTAQSILTQRQTATKMPKRTPLTTKTSALSHSHCPLHHDMQRQKYTLRSPLTHSLLASASNDAPTRQPTPEWNHSITTRKRPGTAEHAGASARDRQTRPHPSRPHSTPTDWYVIPYVSSCQSPLKDSSKNTPNLLYFSQRTLKSTHQPPSTRPHGSRMCAAA